SPNNALTQDVADDVAINSVAALSTTGGDVAASVTVVQSGAPQPGAARLSQALWDTTFVRNGITFQASRTFYDAQNQPLSGFGPLAAKLVWTSSANGTATFDRGGATDPFTVGHDASLPLTGNHLLAAADTFIVNGASDDTLTNHFHSYDGTTSR